MHSLAKVLLLFVAVAAVAINAKPSKGATSRRGTKIIKLAPPYIDSFADEKEEAVEDRRGRGRKPPPMCAVGPVGGSGGKIFSDKTDYLAFGEIAAVRVNGGSLIDSITMKYGYDWGARHGGDGGSRKEATLEDDEYITSVFGSAGEVLDSIGFRTDKGRTLGPWGGQGGRSFDLKVKEDWDCFLAYIEGQAGKLVDRLFFAFECAP